MLVYILSRALDAREDKTVSTDSFIELVESVLKSNVFEDSTSFCKQLSRTAIGTKVTPPYVVIFMSEVEEKLLKDCDKRRLAWWQYKYDIFMLSRHDAKNLKSF